VRDLSNQGAWPRQKTAGKIPILKALVVVVLIVGLLFIVKQKISSGSFIGGGSSGLTDAPRGLTPVSVSNVQGGGVNLSSGSASFRDVKYGGKASASATRTYGAGSYSLTVNATLPDPQGDKYQVWLVSGDQIKNAGFMSGSGESWSLVFNDTSKYASYDAIWITKEITTEDNKPEQHVLEGSF